MKRFVTLVSLALFAAITASAQAVDAQSTKLESKVERAQYSVDSLNMLIAQARERYIAEPSAREMLTKQLITMEEQALRLKQIYDSALAAYNSYQQRLYISEKDSKAEGSVALQQTVVEDTASVAVVPNYPAVANLAYNGVFEQYISPADLRTLRESQNQEGKIVAKIKEYLRHYDRMVSLQLEYERVETEIAADSVVKLLDSVRVVAREVEAGVADSWHAIYDNKIYAYNLLMEQKNRMDLLSSVENELAKALRDGEQSAGSYESDILSEYYYRKSALLGYESCVADVLEIPAAKDSLLKVQRALKQGDYCLPKVNIVRRSFIEHEPLKVIKPTIYTPKNPIPHTRIYEYGTVYRIRIGIFTNRPNLSALRGITPLSYTDKYHGGKYAYFVGGFTSEEDAQEGVAYLKKLGFKDPQLVMWVDGEYISNIAEWKSKNLGYNIEITGVATLSDAVKAHISLRNENCRFSRVGTSFIVGSFASKADAERVISEIVAMDGNIKAELKSVK